MKVAILVGGKGTRMVGLPHGGPKPMLEIGGKPMLRHIMDQYVRYGFNEFVIALGYKGEVIREYFSQASRSENAKIELVDTGQTTATAGRVGRLRSRLEDESFMLTWGDGIADIDLAALLDFHRGHGCLATVTAVHPPARFGYLHIESGQVTDFIEKPAQAPEWINGAFFVLESGVFDYISGDNTSWEYDVMPKLVADQQLMAYQHTGFWQCMDTPREHAFLEQLWQQHKAPWRDKQCES